jgi:hypothetical protein
VVFMNFSQHLATHCMVARNKMQSKARLCNLHGQVDLIYRGQVVSSHLLFF